MRRAIYGTVEMAEGRERLINIVLSLTYRYRGASHARAGAFMVMRRESCFRKIASISVKAVTISTPPCLFERCPMERRRPSLS